MIATRRDGSVINIGDSLDGGTFLGISDPPNNEGNAGGPYSGRVKVADQDGQVSELYPFEVELIIQW